MDTFLSEATVLVITGYVVRIVGVLLFLIIARAVAGWVGRLVYRGLERSTLDETLRRFFATATRYTILVMALIACLEVFGVSATSFAAVLAAAGLAIGLAFQGTLSNFAAGVMLLVFRPFKAGDVISVGGTTAKVAEVELFTTLLDTPDNRRVIMPNGSIFGSTIENLSHHDTRRVDVGVGTSYDADLALTRGVLEDAAAKLTGRLDAPPPQVVLTSLGDSTIDWQVRVWCRAADYSAVHEQLTQTVKLALDAADIAIPYPQLDVHVGASAVMMDVPLTGAPDASLPQAPDRPIPHAK